MVITLLLPVRSYHFPKCTSNFCVSASGESMSEWTMVPLWHVVMYGVAVMFHCSWLHGRNQYCIKSHHPSAFRTLLSYLKSVDHRCRPSCYFEILFVITTKIILTQKRNHIFIANAGIGGGIPSTQWPRAASSLWLIWEIWYFNVRIEKYFTLCYTVKILFKELEPSRRKNISVVSYL